MLSALVLSLHILSMRLLFYVLVLTNLPNTHSRIPYFSQQDAEAHGRPGRSVQTLSFRSLHPNPFQLVTELD